MFNTGTAGKLVLQSLETHLDELVLYVYIILIKFDHLFKQIQNLIESFQIADKDHSGYLTESNTDL